MTGLATETLEHPVFFSASGEDLFGIITDPVGEPKGVGLVLVMAGGFLPATGRNQLSVRIARRVAALGFHVLRFDYHGVGESSGQIESYRLDRPFVDDLLGAVSCLEAHGVREIATAGTCFGARTALASANRISGLRGIALLAPPVRDFEMGAMSIEKTPTSAFLKRAVSAHALRGLLNPGTRDRYRRIVRTKLGSTRSARRLPGASRETANGVSPRFAAPLAELGARGTPVLIAYGEEDEFYGPFEEAAPELAAVFDSPGSRIETRIIPGKIHGGSRLAAQDAIADMIEEWMAGLDAAPAAA